MEICTYEHDYYRGLVRNAHTDILAVNDGKSYQEIPIESVDQLVAMLRGVRDVKPYYQP